MLTRYNDMMTKRPNFWTIFDDFDQFLGGLGREQVIRSTFNDSHHIETDEKEMRLLVDVPGIKLNDLEVTIQDAERIITIKGMQRGRQVTHRYTVADGYNLGTVMATLADGVLMLTIPTQAETPTRKIDIQAK